MKKTTPAYKFLFVSLLLLLFSGCQTRRGEGVLSPRVMERVLYDYHMAQSMAMALPRDRRYERELFYQYVFDKNHITKEEFETSIRWYTRYPKDFHQIYVNVRAKAESERKKAASVLEKINKVSFSVFSGDSVDLWYLPHTQIFASNPYSQTMRFAIQHDTTFYSGDSLYWNMNPLFISVNDSIRTAQSAYLSFNINYRDSITAFDTLVTLNDSLSFPFVLSKKQIFKNIEGAIHYIPSEYNDCSFLLMDDITLIRKHN